MRVLELRRHSLRPKPGVHLSQTGVSLARRVGEDRGSFDLVLTSDIPRAFETAIAMGYAVDEQVRWLSVPPDQVEEELPYPASFSQYAAAARGGAAAVAAFARGQAERWREVAHRLPPDGAALLVTHGGVIEMGAVALLSAAGGFDALGGALGYCEGMRLRFDEGAERCVGWEMLRVPQPPPS